MKSCLNDSASDAPGFASVLYSLGGPKQILPFSITQIAFLTDSKKSN